MQQFFIHQALQVFQKEFFQASKYLATLFSWALVTTLKREVENAEN
jgi:hypothetical protein